MAIINFHCNFTSVSLRDVFLFLFLKRKKCILAFAVVNWLLDYFSELLLVGLKCVVCHFNLV